MKTENVKRATAVGRLAATMIAVSGIAFAGCSAEAGSPTDTAGPAKESVGQTSQALEIWDWGYGNYPQMWTDVNQDGVEDYCRFVGDYPNIFLSCKIGTWDGSETDEYGYNSVAGIDVGYSSLPRGLVNVNNDQWLDWCRFVGNRGHERLSCNLGRDWGFDGNQYTFNSGEIDLGRNNSARKFLDGNSDGRMDFCRVTGSGPYFYCCEQANIQGFSRGPCWSSPKDGPTWAR